MLPAPAQGAIALEIRADDEHAARYVAAIDDAVTSICVAAERAFLAVLGGDCRTPIAALAQIDDGALAVPRRDPQARRQRALGRGARRRAGRGADAGDGCRRELLGRAGPGFFA